MEDFAAHSNFCELALVAMGHTDVFVHVGDRVRIQAPSGKNVAPLVTGVVLTFEPATVSNVVRQAHSVRATSSTVCLEVSLSFIASKHLLTHRCRQRPAITL